MIRRHLVALVLALLASFGFGSWASAQWFEPAEPVEPPVVLSGSDLGLRVEARRGEAILGSLVIRIDGEWVAVGERGPRPLGSN